MVCWFIGGSLGWILSRLGLMDGCGHGRVVVRSLIWVRLVGFSGWCGLLVLGWVWGLGWPGFCFGPNGTYQ